MDFSSTFRRRQRPFFFLFKAAITSSTSGPAVRHLQIRCPVLINVANISAVCFMAPLGSFISFDLDSSLVYTAIRESSVSSLGLAEVGIPYDCLQRIGYDSEALKNCFTEKKVNFKIFLLDHLGSIYVQQYHIRIRC